MSVTSKQSNVQTYLHAFVWQCIKLYVCTYISQIEILHWTSWLPDYSSTKHTKTWAEAYMAMSQKPGRCCFPQLVVICNNVGSCYSNNKLSPSHYHFYGWDSNHQKWVVPMTLRHSHISRFCPFQTKVVLKKKNTYNPIVEGMNIHPYQLLEGVKKTTYCWVYWPIVICRALW